MLGSFISPIAAITALQQRSLEWGNDPHLPIGLSGREPAAQMANYLSQYSAEEGWIPWDKAKSVNWLRDDSV
jgi:hypothetical protein